MSSDDIAISVRNLTKTYRLFSHPGDRVKQFFSFGFRQYHREFTALKDVSFDIRKGETVGIVGRNGSGKSTLLQLICGILKPTAGSVQVNGRVSALLELGAGFNPEFTGRENVYFQGALMGFTETQMDERFDDIAAFADIGEFIDQPVRTYSSGMYVRLAFAVAVSVEPDILIVDEALAVGDVQFQARCYHLLEQWKAESRTIVLVSHAMELVVRLCDSTLLLDQGKLEFLGKPAEVAAKYHRVISGWNLESAGDPGVSGLAADENLQCRPYYNPGENRYGNQEARLVDCLWLDQNGCTVVHLEHGTNLLKIRLFIHCTEPMDCPTIGLSIRTPEGVTVYGSNSLERSASIPGSLHGPGIHALEWSLVPYLSAGNYFVSVGITRVTSNGVVPLDRRIDCMRLVVSAPAQVAGMIAMQSGLHYLGAGGET